MSFMNPANVYWAAPQYKQTNLKPVWGHLGFLMNLPYPDPVSTQATYGEGNENIYGSVGAGIRHVVKRSHRTQNTAGAHGPANPNLSFVVLSDTGRSENLGSACEQIFASFFNP